MDHRTILRAALVIVVAVALLPMTALRASAAHSWGGPSVETMDEYCKSLGWDAGMDWIAPHAYGMQCFKSDGTHTGIVMDDVCEYLHPDKAPLYGLLVKFYDVKPYITGWGCVGYSVGRIGRLSRLSAYCRTWSSGQMDHAVNYGNNAMGWHCVWADGSHPGQIILEEACRWRYRNENEQVWVLHRIDNFGDRNAISCWG